MPRAHRQVSLWRLMIAVLALANLAGLVSVLSWVSFFPGTAGQPPWTRYMWDGRVLECSVYLRQDLFVTYTRPVLVPWTVLAGPSLEGALYVWWPVVVSGGASLLVLGAARVPVVRRLTEKQVGLPRITIFGGMVVVGVVAYWFWLSGTNAYWILRGIAVLFLTLVAGHRWRRLALEMKAGPAAASGRVRLGVAGYSVVMLLAAVWLVAALVSESFTPRHN
jgi:hypothetical protein